MNYSKTLIFDDTKMSVLGHLGAVPYTFLFFNVLYVSPSNNEMKPSGASW